MLKVGAAHKPRIFKFRENQMREIQEVPVLENQYVKLPGALPPVLTMVLSQKVEMKVLDGMTNSFIHY